MTATYAVTQADLDAGTISNSASGSGQTPDPENPTQPDPTQPPVEPEKPGTVDIPADKNPEPSNTVTKVANRKQYKKTGDEIQYTITVTNTGTVIVEGLLIEDSLVAFADMTLKESVISNGTLDLNEVWTLTYSYTISEDDVKRGSVLNLVRVIDPANPNDNPVSDELEVPKADEPSKPLPIPRTGEHDRHYTYLAWMLIVAAAVLTTRRKIIREEDENH